MDTPSAKRSEFFAPPLGYDMTAPAGNSWDNRILRQLNIVGDRQTRLHRKTFNLDSS